MISAFNIVRDGRLQADAALRPVDLQLHCGDLTLTPAGAVAHLYGPLAKYSRHYDWPAVTTGYATLRSLMEDIRYGEHATFDLVCARFSLPKGVADPIAEKAIGKIEWTEEFPPPKRARTSRSGTGKTTPPATKRVRASRSAKAVQEVLYHDSDLIEDAQRILDWGPELEKRCPDESVAERIHRIMRMDRRSLYEYVKGALGMG